MEKLSTAEVAALLKESAALHRWSHDQLKEALEKIATFERKDRARKIASKMDNEMRDGLSIEEKAEKLASSGENLDVLERAVDLRTQDPKLASVSDGVASDYNSPEQVPEGQAAQAMTEWLLTDTTPFSGL